MNGRFPSSCETPTRSSPSIGQFPMRVMGLLPLLFIAGVAGRWPTKRGMAVDGFVRVPIAPRRF